MSIIAYIYTDPLLESPPSQEFWGLEVDRVYQDLGQRQQLQQLIVDCQIETPSHLLIRCLEELGDTVDEVSDRLLLLESLGIDIIAVEQDYCSSQSNQGNISDNKATLLKLIPEIQNNQSKRRLKQGHARNRLKSLPPPGKAPYGYRRGQDKYIIDKSTAPVVKAFFEQFLLFGSLRGAVRYLEKRYGKKISPSTGRCWLTNPVYRGNLAYKNGEIVSNTHAAIISPEEAAQIDRLLRRNSRFSPRTASAPRSLAGLVYCQKCSSSMKITRVTRRGKKQEYLYLRPINCPQQSKCKAISYQKILQETIDCICRDLPNTVTQLQLPNINTIQTSIKAKIQQKKEILQQIPTLEKQGILDEETANLRRYKLQIEIAELTQQLAQLPPGNLPAIASTVSIPQFWLDLSEAERRFYFREFIKQIEIVRFAAEKWQLKLVFIF